MTIGETKQVKIHKMSGEVVDTNTTGALRGGYGRMEKALSWGNLPWEKHQLMLIIYYIFGQGTLLIPLPVVCMTKITLSISSLFY
jgi:hypothetical protein